ncbi:hypothetical protein [Paraburkholderia tagetis]|uniref:hypothetical protein n=1 Tax=Paraburkholderia tagetis TaxID=2913261 RepID=UPI003084693F
MNFLDGHLFPENQPPLIIKPGSSGRLGARCAIASNFFQHARQPPPSRLVETSADVHTGAGAE